MRYTPFDVDLGEIAEDHIAGLRDVTEGWYVEYKSRVPSVRDLAKVLSSFANTSGGWLFLGVQEDPKDNTAASFPGIANSDVPTALEQVRNAAKDLLQPDVRYFHRVLAGSLPAVALDEGRSIVVLRIPEGASTPYIHNDGRIYIRVGDSSTPRAATDKATFDLLYRRSQDKAAMLDALLDRDRQVSEAEQNTTYLHLAMLSDPYGNLGHRYSGAFSEFSDAMISDELPFTNIYTYNEGYIARQTHGNDPFARVFTWEFSRECQSFVTVPLNTILVPPRDEDGQFYHPEDWSPYVNGERFASLVTDGRLDQCRIVNLNLLVFLISGIVFRHQTLCAYDGIKGPFYVKVRVENAWRTVPFIDSDSYLRHIARFGIPVVQDDEFSVPPRGRPETFIGVPELESVPDKLDTGSYELAIPVWLTVMEAFGVPREIFRSRDSVRELIDAAARESAQNRARLAAGG